MATVLTIDHNSTIDTSDGNISVKVSSEEGNTLTIENDGLYAEALPGDPGTTGVGYPDLYHSANGIKTGQTTPYSYDFMTRRIVAPAIVHRIFYASDSDASDIGANIRPFDRIYPGDMYAVFNDSGELWSYDYYVILSVNAAGNRVASHSGIVANIPITAPI